MASSSPAQLREQRLHEGLCPQCGTRLYKIVKQNRRPTMKGMFGGKNKNSALFDNDGNNNNDGSGDNVKMIPLTLPGVVERGQCMKCPQGGGMSSSPAVKAVPVTITKNNQSEDDNNNPQRKLSNASSSNDDRYQRYDTNESKQSTDTEYEDAPLLDIRSLDIHDPLGDRGIRYNRTESGPNDDGDKGEEDDLLGMMAPIPNRDMDSHFATAAAASAVSGSSTTEVTAAMIPSKPQALDCPAGMAPEVFYQLPPEVQREVSSSSTQKIKDGGDDVIDPDILASLPEHLRQEVLDQQQQQQTNSSSTSNTPSLSNKAVSFSSEDNRNVVTRSNSKRMEKNNKQRTALSQSTKEFLSEFDIDEQDFDDLDEEVQNDLLAEKRKGESKLPASSHSSNTTARSGSKSNNARHDKMKMSLTKSTKVFLADLDIDEEDFDDLDEDVKTSLLANRKNSSSSNNNNGNGGDDGGGNNETQYDQDLLASLPEDLREEILEEERRKRSNSSSGGVGGANNLHRVGAHHSNVPAGYDPDTFEALPLEMQQELLDAANDGIVYSADGYGSDSIARAPLAVATAAGQEKATYEGEYNDFGKRHGEGTLTWANGDVYKGWFKNGFMEGRGTINFHDGTEYSGQWHKNKFHGMGTRRFKNGNVYTGNYESGRRQGQGKCFFANGDLYSGDWKNDTIQGFGRYYYNNGHSFEGMFRNGMRNGRGKYQLTDGRVEIYRYVNDNRVGDGVRWSSDRKKAWKMNGGKVVKRISMEDATAIANRCGPVLEES